MNLKNISDYGWHCTHGTRSEWGESPQQAMAHTAPVIPYGAVAAAIADQITLGRLVSLCFNQPNRHAALKANATQWIDLGPGAFKETGTQIDTAICVMDNSTP